MSSKSTTVTLRVSRDHIKSLPDPNGLGRKRWVAQVPVDEIHRSRIEFGPNPRKQNLETKVAEAIHESLRANLGWFLYFSKGIVLCAKSASYDNKAESLELIFDKDTVDPWDSPHGNLDGGHTNAVILRAIDQKWKNPANNAERQYVTVEILTGIDTDRLSDLVALGTQTFRLKIYP